MTIIDLGEVTATEFEPPPRPAHSRVRPVRRFTLALVALLTVVTTTASARTAAPMGLRPLWNIAMTDADTAYLSGDAVLLNRMTGNRATLTSYDVATGARRWTADVGSTSSYPDLLTGSGVLLQPVAFTEVQSAGGTVAFTATTAALDGATGTRLWQTNASAVHAEGDTVLMTEHDAQGRVTRIRLARLDDGGTIWSRALVANGVVTASDDAIVTIDDHGTVTVLRRADGEVLRTGMVPWIADRLPDVHNDVSIAGGALILRRWDQQGTTTAAVYRLDTLAAVAHSNGYISDCGVVLCATEGNGTVGLDPLTGAERWRLDQVPGTDPIGSGQLLGQTGSDADEHQQLIDARTGRIIGTFGPGQRPWAWRRTSGPLLMLRPVGAAPMHVTVLQIDRTTGEEFTLGALGWMGDSIGQCQANARYLMCPGQQRLTVTAVG